MLEQMRKQSHSTLILLLFGFIVFVFVFSFGSGSEGFRSGGCGSTGLVAIVNGEEITEVNFQFHYDQMLKNALQQRQQGKALRKEDKLQLRQQVLDELINQALLIQAAQTLGIHVTKEEAYQAIYDDFEQGGNTFDFNHYQAVVQRHFRTTTAIYEDVRRQGLLAERMRAVIRDTARVTDDELVSAYQARETKINLDFVKVDSTLFAKELAPSEEEIKQFATDNQKEIEQTYQARNNRYHKPKQVQLAHVQFVLRKEYDEEQVADKQERADLTWDDLKKGGDFAEQVKEYSEDYDTKEKGGQLAMATKEALAATWGAAFAQAAFELKAGEFSPVIKSNKGFHVLKAMRIIAANDKTLDQVKDEIAKELLSNQRSQAAAKAEAERLLAGLQAGKKLAVLAPAAKGEPGLPPTKPRAASTGLIARMGGFIPQIGLDDDLAQAAFALTMENPTPNQVFEVNAGMGGKSYVVISLAERVEADMDAFAKNREMLSERLLAGRRHQQLSAWLSHERDTAVIEKDHRIIADITPPGMRGGQQ